MSGLIEALASFVIATISSAGYAGIAGLMAIESACMPLPSEIIMPFAGYLVSTGTFNLLLATTAGALGCNIGSAVAYSVGYHGGRPLVARYGRYLLFGESELAHAERFFARYGSLAIFVGRLLPGVRTFIALPAGIARMRLLPFHAYTFAGSWPFCFVLAYVGMKLGERWESDPTLRTVMHRFEGVIVVAGLACIAAFVTWRIRARAS